MANSVVLSRTHLIYGVCLPLAVLVGYFLAEPFDLGSIAVVTMVLGVLCIPLLMRWHHALLICSCNALVCPYFLPGRPALWNIAVALSFGILLLNRTLGGNVDFFKARSVSRSLIFITAVVIVTAYASGGIGFYAFGSRTIGSKRYIYLLLGVIAYFGFSTVAIPRRWAKWAVGVFFLSALTGMVGYIAAWGGQSLYFLENFFPIEGAVDELAGPQNLLNPGFARYGGLMSISQGIAFFMFAKYGTRGICDLSRPWRCCIFLACCVGCLFSGFRSAIILILLIFALLFYVEGLFRSRVFPALLLVMMLGGAVMVGFASKMPLPVQRSLAFLPIDLNPIARGSAEESSDWRFEMWKEVLPTVPKYLIKGKGLGLTADEMALVAQAQQFGTARGWEGSMIAGDYHSGPLSLIIPFGLFGVAGFVWFLWASVQVLRKNYLYGDESLRLINRFLFVFFIVRIFFYFFVFGSFYSDMIIFTSLIGLSVSLNGGVCQPSEPDEEMELEYATA